MLRHCYISEATASIYIASCTSIDVIVYEATSVLDIIMSFGCADRNTVVMQDRILFFYEEIFLLVFLLHIYLSRQSSAYFSIVVCPGLMHPNLMSLCMNVYLYWIPWLPVVQTGTVYKVCCL